MPASQPANFNLQEFTDAGLLLLGGRLYTYAYGTTAQKTAYTDPAAAVPHTYTADGAGGQYIALNARGELPAPLYLAPGAYDIALKRADGSTVWTRRADPTGDNVAVLATSVGSGLIGFIQNLVGAVLRTLQDKLRESVSIKDFGAIGDGAVDDTAAIQAALASGAQIVYCPAPSAFYRTTAPIRIPSGVSLRGRLRTGFIGATWQATRPCIRKTTNTTVLIPRNENGANVARDCVFYIDPAFSGTFYPQDFEIAGLSISGAGGALIDYGVFMDQGSDLHLVDCDFYGVKHGFYGRTIWRCVFERIRNACRFTVETGGTSLKLDNVGQNGNPNTFDGIFLNGVGYSSMISCTSDGCYEPAFNFSNCSGLVLTGCGAEANNYVSVTNGWAINSTSSSTLKVVGFVSVPKAGSTTPILSAAAGDVVNFESCYLANARAGVPAMKDLYISWDARVTFNNCRFNAFANYDAPLITFDGSATTNNILITSAADSKVISPANTATFSIGTAATYLLKLTADAVEKFRVDNAGNFLMGATAPQTNSKMLVKSGAGFGGVSFKSDSSTAASTSWFHFYGTSADASVANIFIYGNGNIQNSNNSYGAISDIRLKENITSATPKLAQLMNVRIVNYNLKTDPTLKQLGVVAQELELVFPGLVETIPDIDVDGALTGTNTKSVKYSVFVPILIKSMQELKAEFDAYRASHP
jgi:hypothetical protein